MLRSRLALALVLLQVACGGGNPAGPSGPDSPGSIVPAGTVLSFASGETDAPVAGATVALSGRSLTTSAAGEVTLAVAVPRGSLLDVAAPGFLDRQTLLGSPTGQTRFTLWPRASATGLSEHTTAELVYTSGAGCCPADALAAQPLRRVAPGITTFSVVLAPEYRGYPATVEALAEAAALAGQASGARITFMPSSSASGARIDVTTGSDPAGRANIAAFADRRFDTQGYIVGGRVVVVDPGILTGRWSRTTLVTLLAHELGHMLGLGHSSTPGVMWVVNGTGMNYRYFASHHDFSPAEKLALGLMLQRRAMTRFPDNDRSAAASSQRGDRIVCEL